MLEALAGRGVLRIQLQRLAIRGGRSRHVSLTLERRAEQALRLRRFRLELGGTPELRRGLFEIAPVERGPPVGDVEQRVLGAIASGHELASSLELRRAFLPAARPHERQPQLVVRLGAHRALRLELHGVLQRGDRFGRLPVLQERLAQREVRPREVGSHLDHLPEVLDFLLGPVSGTGPVGHSKIEESLHRSGRQPDRLLQLLDRRLGIGRRQRRSEVRAGFRVGWRKADRFTQRGYALLVVPGLNEHESKVVVCFGVVRTDADRCSKRRNHILGACTLPSEHEPEHVLRFGHLRMLGTRSERLTKRGDRRIPRWRGRHRHGHVQPGFELPKTLFQMALPQERDAEIDVSGRHRG